MKHKAMSSIYLWCSLELGDFLLQGSTSDTWTHYSSRTAPRTRASCPSCQARYGWPTSPTSTHEGTQLCACLDWRHACSSTQASYSSNATCPYLSGGTTSAPSTFWTTDVRPTPPPVRYTKVSHATYVRERVLQNTKETEIKVNETKHYQVAIF